MNYNIHPIFVHFPIAFLMLYSVIVILPLQKWFPSVAWRQIRNTLLIAGVIGAFVALQTGEIAEQLTQPNHDLVEMHSTFATIATFSYSLILAGEILGWIQGWAFRQMPSQRFQAVYIKVRSFPTHKFFVITLSLVGLVAIVVTGLLGGVLVYGLSADPVAPFVLRILGIVL